MVTLLGTKEDWQKLLARIDKLKSFGKEPAEWGKLLRPILSKFVDAFEGNHYPRFWAKICHLKAFGSGSTELSGWITNFCVWNSEGKWIGPQLPIPKTVLSGGGHPVPLDCLPPAICEVDVKLDDHGKKFDCVMVAGHVGSETIGASRDTFGMVPAWFMAIKQKAEEE